MVSASYPTRRRSSLVTRSKSSSRLAEPSSIRETSISVSYDRSLAAWVSRSGGERSGKGSAPEVRGNAPLLMVPPGGSPAHSPDGGSPRRNDLDSGPIARQDEGAASHMPDTDAILTRLGLDPASMRDGDLEVRTPI